MCRRVWLVALVATALSVASAVVHVGEEGWTAGAVLSSLTALASFLIVVITYMRRHADDCGPIVLGDVAKLNEDA